MLQRHEDADAAGRRIDGADEGDQQQHGIGVGVGKGEAGRDHQAAGAPAAAGVDPPLRRGSRCRASSAPSPAGPGWRRCRPRRRQARERSDRRAAARRRNRRRSRAAPAPHTRVAIGLACVARSDSVKPVRRCIRSSLACSNWSRLSPPECRSDRTASRCRCEMPPGRQPTPLQRPVRRCRSKSKITNSSADRRPSLPPRSKLGEVGMDLLASQRSPHARRDARSPPAAQASRSSTRMRARRMSRAQSPASRDCRRRRLRQSSPRDPCRR